MHVIKAFEFVFTRFPTRWGQTCLPCSSCSAVDDGTKNSLQRYGDRSKWTASDVGEAQDVNLHHARAHTHTHTHAHTRTHTLSLDLSRPLSTSLDLSLRTLTLVHLCEHAKETTGVQERRRGFNPHLAVPAQLEKQLQHGVNL